MIVTRSDRHGKAKSIQPGNREWATVIECINAKGWCIPPFVIVQGAYHLANWTTESGFPPSWIIKPTPNGWTDNKTGLDWIRHFDKHTKQRTMETSGKTGPTNCGRPTGLALTQSHSATWPAGSP
jgi:hypothetical protein